ncbi:magnesium/cobalt transporter CorA [Edaphovirga cremea]|uniref:magnesium/cobalt transporter CorA n=1 Tax=Edaphovirga cremea TaxID=2267246 RepID=UPI0039894AA0
MIVNSMVYRTGSHGESINVDDISEIIHEKDAFIWLGLWQPEPSFMYKVQEEFSLHELAIEDALNAHQRPKIERYGESLFIVVKTVRRAQENTEFGETHFFVGRNFLITIRHGKSDGYAPIRERVSENPAMLVHGPGYPLYCILDFIVDGYSELTVSLSEKISEMEDAMFRSEFDRSAVQTVYSMRHQLLELRNAAVPVEDICTQLIRLHNEIIPKPLQAYIRDVQDHARHVVTDADDMREMLTSAMHVNLALVTVQQNEVVKKLAGWGAVLAIPTVIFSLYGMNFDFMPELHSRFSYPVVLAATLCSCVLLWNKLKRSGWL